MISRILLLVLTYNCLFFYGYSQNRISENTVALHDSGNEQDSEAKEAAKMHMWAIKTDIAKIASGNINLQGEVKLMEKYGLEVGAGIVWDYVANFFDTENPPGVLDDKARPRAGFATNASFKMYFDKYDEPLEGLWIGLTTYYRLNRYAYENNAQTFNSSKAKYGLGFIVGKQFFSYSGFVIEFMFGASAVKIDRSYYNTVEISLTEEEDVLTRNSRIRPNAFFGFRIGFGQI